MAAVMPCDICQAEPAVQMLSNLTDGTTMTLGEHCSFVFFGQAQLSMLESDGHKSTTAKCQACRRIHEQMMLAYNPPPEPAPAPAPGEPADAPAP